MDFKNGFSRSRNTHPNFRKIQHAVSQKCRNIWQSPHPHHHAICSLLLINKILETIITLMAQTLLAFFLLTSPLGTTV